MGYTYRGLTEKEFEVVRRAAGIICKRKGDFTIKEYERIGNKIIDQLEAKTILWSTLLQDEIEWEE